MNVGTVRHWGKIVCVTICTARVGIDLFDYIGTLVAPVGTNQLYALLSNSASSWLFHRGMPRAWSVVIHE